MGAFDWLKRNPLAVAAGAALIVIIRPRRSLQLASRGIFVWRLWLGLKARLGKVTP